jgi:error-prone DNA polymerase
MEGVPSLDALVVAAIQQGCPALALTDTNGLYGAIRFLDRAREAGLRPILGSEVIANDHRAVLLATSAQGYANLCRVLSAIHCDPEFDLLTAVANHRQGLIVLSDDIHDLQRWKHDSKEDLYVELTPGAFMHQALAFSRASDLPPVATCRARFVHAKDYPLHRVLRAIALNTTLSRLPADACSADSQWLMPSARLERYFPHVPHALTNSLRISEQCKTDWDFHEVIFPQFRQLGREEAFDLLKEKAYAGAQWRYGELPPGVRERLDHELDVIRDKGYADYFLIVAEMVAQAPRTCGRGSAAASIVSYCLGITHVDPIQHKLFFERFLNPGRHDPPDIDIDFPWDERDKVLDWVFAKYGARSAAMVANQNMVGVKRALREVAKVFGMPAAEIKTVSAQIGRQSALLDEAESAEGWIQRISTRLQLPPPLPEILRYALQIDEHFRNLGLHCGGIVIVPDDIRRYVPVEISAKGMPVIQWEKDQTEEAGLVKIDLLGNRSLSVIRDALSAVARNTGRTIEYATWDALSDPATQDLIRRGDTMGCFYIESPATRLLLKKLFGHMPADRLAKGNVFEYLTIVSSLVRPAAITFVDEFLRRAHGEPYHSWHPLLDAILDETLGIMVYQEDVIKVAMALAGFSIEAADDLRKVLSKKHKQRKLCDYYDQFVAGCTARGVTVGTIRRIWEMILSFAGYSFCKPHSASYAQVSFKAAYLRAHYPAEFMAAVISNQGGFYSPFAYLSEARRMGLQIVPPDLNASEWPYTGQGRSIRIGLMQIKGLRRVLVERLVEDRRTHGPFRSLWDFLARVRPDVAQARLLIKAGCCDGIAGELTRPALLWRLLARQQAAASSARPMLYDQREAVKEAFPIPEEYSEAQQLQDEVKLFGFPLRCHPLDLCEPLLKSLRPIAGKDVGRYVGQRVTLVGWLLTEKMAETKHGEPMEFVTFEDTTAIYDVTIFPDAYRRYYHLLGVSQGYVIEGLVEESFGVLTVTLSDLQLLSLTEKDMEQRGHFDEDYRAWNFRN